MMPDLDGIEATKIIRSLEGEYFKKVPIIALTANTIVSAEKMFIQSGMSDFLAKPIKTSELNKILNKWIPEFKKECCTNHKNVAVKDETDHFINALRKVPGLSIDKALDILDGSAESYERIVKLTASLLPESIEKLNKLIESDLPLYRVEVHGVKGALRNIGAYVISETAQMLEDMANMGIIDDCKQLHISFNNECSSLLKYLTPLIKDTDIEKTEGDFAKINQALPELEEAAEFFDRTAALRILGKLNEYTYGHEIDIALWEITHSFELYNFNGILSKIEELRQLLP